MENPLDDIDRIEKIRDPAERAREIGRRLGLLPEWQERMRVARQNAVLEMRDNGMTFAQIGAALGLHRNRVQQIAEGRTAGGQGTGPQALPRGMETAKDAGKTVYEFTVLGPIDTAEPVLNNAGSGFWTDGAPGPGIRVHSRTRPTAIRVYELCIAAGCTIQGREDDG